jgi:hypothetical protein
VRLDFDLTAYYANYFTTDFQVWANYVYLDTEERRRFAQKGHEYLIEQVQHTGGDSVTANDNSQLVRLSFNHPVKEFIWCYQNPNPTTSLNAMWNFATGTANVNVSVSALGPTYATANATSTAFTTSVAGGTSLLPHEVGCPHLFSNTAGVANVFWVEEGAPVTGASGYETGPLTQFKLILNGQDRFKEQLGKYFNQYQPYRYHTGTPYVGIYVYSFALQPEEHQPTGTCNFSRIDNAQVSVVLKSQTTSGSSQQKLFAVNYNILRIQSGMGGLAFSN